EQDRLGLDSDPLSLIMLWNASATFMYAHRFDDAIAMAKRGSEVDPLSLLPHGGLARIYELQGRIPEGLAILEKYMPEGVHPGARGMIAKLREAYEKDGAAGYWRTALQFELGADPKHPRDKIRVAM